MAGSTLSWRDSFAPIGIMKGQKFDPDERMKRILTEAVAIGNGYARVNTVYPQDEGSYVYHDVHTEWVMAYPDKDTTFLQEGARRMDGRLWMHYNAVCVTPAMAVTKPGAGSDYMITGLDGKGRPLDGAKTYKLHLPPNVPGQGQLVGDHLRPADPEHAADRPDVRRNQQPERRSEAERRRFHRRHLRS